ncbi:DNA primase [Fontimonas thermophila]|uniref:DNA primase n=1 Tax=Fontimonas thermophila TaxID=1076937 RepID=A0A1I2GWM7_9GAMM|nr:DNA primase [Fontimonas thermophila]SFF22324.1 DNA primase [Fontimonas thermophila]
MSRIPEAFIHDLLARTDIVELIGERIELKRAGKEYRGLSPFTNEKTPSFFVSPQKQMFFDFSSGKNGNAIGFLMAYDRLSFVEAVEELARRAGLEVPREGGAPARVLMDGPLDALAAAERFFRDRLRQTPVAIDYLKKRGVSGETAKRYGIGYAPDRWDALTEFLKDTRHAIEAGLLVPREGGGCYDRFRHRIMFPIRDTRGRVTGFGGRTLGNDPAKYLNTPETPLFHKGRTLYGLYEARQASTGPLAQLVVVEGYMDVVMLAQHGIHEAVATLGTATTRDHLQLIFKTANRVVFCFDGDRAGRAAAWRALEQTLPELHDGRECAFMFLPEGHDPDTLVQTIGAEAFRARMRAAQPLSQFLLGELVRQVDLGTLEGRARLLALARPHLDKLPAGSLRTLLLDELAHLARMDRTDVEQALRRSDPPARGNAPPAAAERGSAAARPVRRLMQLLLERPALAERAEHVELLAQANVPGTDVLVAAIDFFQAHPGATAAQLLAAWTDTARGRAIGRLLADPLPPLDDTALEAEFRDGLHRLCQRALKARVEALLAQARIRTLTEAETREIEAMTRQMRTRPPDT